MKHYNIEVHLPGEKEPAISHYDLKDRPMLTNPSTGYRQMEFIVVTTRIMVSLPPEALVTIKCVER